MKIQWFNDKAKNIIVTITTKNITVNKVGVKFFEHAKEVLLGYNNSERVIIIKPLSKDDIIRGDYPDHSRYNISMSSSYVRITNKAFIKKISEVFNLNLDNKANLKFKANWETKLDALRISVEEVI